MRFARTARQIATLLAASVLLAGPRRGERVRVCPADTEYLAPLDWQVQRRAGLVVVVGRSLLTGLVRAVPVVVPDVLVQDR